VIRPVRPAGFAGDRSQGAPLLVSVVIPAYNAAVFVGAAIDSVLRQTHQDLELFVVDDGSTDDTASVVQSYVDRDDRVHLVRKANGKRVASPNVSWW